MKVVVNIVVANSNTMYYSSRIRGQKVPQILNPKKTYVELLPEVLLDDNWQEGTVEVLRRTNTNLKPSLQDA